MNCVKSLECKEAPRRTISEGGQGAIQCMAFWREIALCPFQEKNPIQAEQTLH